MKSGKFAFGDILNPDSADTSVASAISHQSPLEMLVQTCNNIGKGLDGESRECDAKKTLLSATSKAKTKVPGRNYAPHISPELHEKSLALQTIPDELSKPMFGLESLAAAIDRERLSHTRAALVMPSIEALQASYLASSRLPQYTTDTGKMTNTYQSWLDLLASMQSRSLSSNDPSYPLNSSSGCPSLYFNSMIQPQRSNVWCPPRQAPPSPPYQTVANVPSINNNINVNSNASYSMLSYLCALAQLKSAVPESTAAENASPCRVCACIGCTQHSDTQTAQLSRSTSSNDSNDSNAHVCNWLAAASEDRSRVFCGARFSTSEQLMKHLRSHVLDDQSDARAHLATSADCKRAVKRPIDDDRDAAVPKSRRLLATASHKFHETDVKCDSNMTAADLH